MKYVFDTQSCEDTCFWLLRHKPLQINWQFDGQSLVLLMRTYLFSESDDIPILNNKKEEVDNFTTTL